MTVFPFELVIERAAPCKQVESVLCKGSLREIPGRREVYDASWNEKAVIAKVFSRRIGAWRRLRKERVGLQKLKDCGVHSPELLFWGKTSKGRLAVVTEKIADAPTVLEALKNTASHSERVDLLVRVCRQLAVQHIRGVIQKDLHLGNLLLDEERILMLDPGQMHFAGRPLGRAKSISQLALLGRNLPADDNESISRLCREYFAVRQWDFEAVDEKMFAKMTKGHTKRVMRRTLRKCLRTNRRQIRLRNSGCSGVFERAFCGKTPPEDMAEKIDELMAGGEILKDGNTCYISRFIWNGIDVVVKCYKHKSLIHSLRHTLKRSRARHGWRHAHRLGVLEVATPRPLAYIERLKGHVIWKSYFVTEYVDGEKLYYHLRDDNVSAEQRSTTLRRTVEMLDKIAEYGVTHGDVKPSNILVTRDGPCLTDLDSMRANKIAWLGRIRWAKDRARIMDLQQDFEKAENTSESSEPAD